MAGRRRRTKNLYAYRNKNKRRRSGLRRLRTFGLPVFALSLAVVSLFLLNDAISASATLTTGARVFTEGLNIELDRTSPAYAALEDAWADDGSVWSDESPLPPANARLTVSENVVGESVADKLMTENKREQALASQARAARESQVAALAHATADAIREMASRIGQASLPVRHTANTDEKTKPIEHPTQTISLSDLKVSREELVGALLMPIVQARKDVPTDRPVVIARHNEEPVIVGSDPRKLSLVQKEKTPEDIAGLNALEVDAKKESEPLYRQVFISGPLEFVGGIAMSNSQDRVVVYRDVDGETHEAGAVWLREGRYEIFVEDSDGTLFAELQTPYGDILGRGTFDLATLPADLKEPRRIDPIPLKIKPVQQGLVGTVLAHRSGAKAKSLAASGAVLQVRDLPNTVEADAKGKFQDRGFLEGSSVVVKASRMGYWGTMAYLTAGADSQIEVLPDQPNQVIQSLVTLSKSSSRDQRMAAIIWGRVTQNGQPVTGATVELMTSDELVQPVYFNSAMLPDPNLKVTSSNGLYAFYPVVPGAHAVQAHIATMTTEVAVFPADDHTVSRVDLEASVDRPAKLQVFDAFRTDQPLSAQVADPSRNKQFAIDQTGISKFKYSTGNGPLIFDVDSGHGYHVTRVMADRERRSIYAPMVQSSWLEQIRSNLKINRMPHTGTIIGFVQGSQPYQAVLPLTEKTADGVPAPPKLIYFNNRGEPTGKNFGEPGGGFIAVNITEGFRTITIQPSGTTKVYSSTVLVDPNVANVITHSLR